MLGKKTVALVPAFNEAKRIGKTVAALKRIPLIDGIIVIDDGSRDNTGLEAQKAGANVIRTGRNLGKGGALNLALRESDYDVLLLVDGDLADAAIDAEKLLQPVLRGEADMTIADFPKPRLKGGFGLVKKFARWGIKRCTGRVMSEPLCGQRALTREVVERVREFDPGFGVEVGLTIDTIRAGFKVVEIPTTMSHAETGRDIGGFVHRGRQFYHVLKSVLSRLPTWPGR
ncbi:MAG: glycosyltransferase family 2 protein [Actinomycetota bacterium]